MPQNHLECAIKTLNFNAHIKALNTCIMVCHKTNARTLWSDTPTSAYVTDPCESLLSTEWKGSETWIAYRVSKYRWLTLHRLDKEHSRLDSWSDDESESESESKGTQADEGSHPIDSFKNKFGPIPRFSRVYEVEVNVTTMVFGCTCCHQQRMGMPCRHIAAVCRCNESILGPNPTGLPLSSIRVFWWDQYYLYGLSASKDHQKTKQAMIDLSDNDTLGLLCPCRLDSTETYPCPNHIFDAFHKPATYRLLNYDSFDAIGAVQLMQDRNNPHQMTDSVPAGLSQISHLPSQDGFAGEDGDWEYAMEEVSDNKDYGQIHHCTCPTVI
jgi:hypothetical protein